MNGDAPSPGPTNALAVVGATAVAGVSEGWAHGAAGVSMDRRPADELNAELKAYLGRDELRFEVRESGYALTRSGQPVSNLSEGERTAIAFPHFLKSLQDKSFDLTKRTLPGFGWLGSRV